MQKVVMIVEDEPNLIEVICLILSEDNYKFVACPTVRVYRQELSKQIPDLIILDVRLPDGNGIDICTEIKSHETLKEVPVILMSAHLDAKNSAECCADTFVEKPFSIEVFRQKVRQLLNKFSPPHAEVM